MKYLIIGNGAAGTSAAQKLRRLDKDCSITILSSEKHEAYSKCLLSDYLAGEMDEERLFYRRKDFYKTNRIDFFPRHRAVSIDFKAKTVITDNFQGFSSSGSRFAYDRLLIATGSKPFLPGIKGLNSDNSYPLNTLDDAKRILSDSQEARRVVVIGAGFVGLEIAFNLYKNGKEITIIEKAPRVLPGQLDEKAAQIMKEGLEEEGIRVISGTSVSEVLRPGIFKLKRYFDENAVEGILLEDGRALKADMIITATGSVPNIGFLDKNEIKINKGIVIDRYMETSIKDVFAAGDIVESVDAVTQSQSLSPIWPNAVIQGEYAAYNMSGIKKEFESLISMQNASEFREIPMVSMGIVDTNSPEYCEFVNFRPEKRIYRKLVFKGDCLVGIILLGDIKNSGVFGALMKNKVNLGKVKDNMLAPNFGYSEVCI